ncbi:peptidoglycan-associated lipoprotein Pal [Geomonas sp. RF6]|uniref:peptidoglycan-associated lipoprotein Pal n=1 Tax=Geomonas sp. RF6 TaxID=2897342 RepID=UPI001E6303B7|nr:peptidoglycan-associated lipoprotein Pal [Geomonas sp. RF6]UFS71817.1 peptidoglycan-associated lipoprotein Pal [Geomonas sp. RF6]
MRKGISGSLVVLCCGALLMAGCAHKEQVKPSEPVSTTQQPPAAQPPVEAPRQASPRETAPQQAPLPETRTDESTIRPEQRPVEQGAGSVQAELEKVYFDYDSSSLSQEARNTLSKSAQYLSRNSQVKVRVEGHCDERGSDEYNMALGERRAKAARDYLVNLGISSDRLSTISYGHEKPADPGHDEAAWAKNRRDEFTIIK